MSDHAPRRFQPSAAHLTTRCAGWAKLSKGVEEEETDASREGTAVHSVAAGILESFQPEHSLMTTSADWVGELAENGLIITSNMFDSAQRYVDELMPLIRGYCSSMYVEHKVIGSRFHPDCWGTLDFAVWKPDMQTLVLRDLKNGHSPVNPVDNEQLIIYAVSLLDEITGGKSLDEHPEITVDMGVVMPNCYDGQPITRNWIVIASDLRSMVNKITASMEEWEDTCSSGIHCKNCPARFKCGTLQTNVSTLVEACGAVSDVSDTLPISEYELLSTASVMIKARLSALSDRMEYALRKGKTMGEYTMVASGSSRKKWICDPLFIGQMAGLDFKKPDAAITVSQAINMMKKAGVDASVINGYYEVIPAKMKLAKLNLKDIFGK